MKKTVLVLLASVVIALSGCSKSNDADEKVTDGVIKIGVLTDLSGLYSDIGGQGSIVAAELAVEDLGGAQTADRPPGKDQKGDRT